MRYAGGGTQAEMGPHALLPILAPSSALLYIPHNPSRTFQPHCSTLEGRSAVTSTYRKQQGLQTETFDAVAVYRMPWTRSAVRTPTRSGGLLDTLTFTKTMNFCKHLGDRSIATDSSEGGFDYNKNKTKGSRPWIPLSDNHHIYSQLYCQRRYSDKEQHNLQQCSESKNDLHSNFIVTEHPTINYIEQKEILAEARKQASCCTYSHLHFVYAAMQNKFSTSPPLGFQKSWHSAVQDIIKRWTRVGTNSFSRSEPSVLDFREMLTAPQ